MEKMDYSLFEDLASTATVEPESSEGVEAPQEDTSDVPSVPEVEEIGQSVTPKEPESGAEAPEPEQDETETETDSDQISALLARVEELQKEVQQSRQPAVKEDEQGAEAPEVIDFLSGIDIDEVLSTPENFNALLNKVHQAGMDKASTRTADRIMRQLPQVISNYVHNHMVMRQITQDFYDKNPDMRAVSTTVSEVANEIANANPELSPEKVFDQTATRVRTMLKLKAPSQEGKTKGGNNAQTNDTSRRRNPGFVGQRGRRASTAPLQGIMKDIEELIAE